MNQEFENRLAREILKKNGAFEPTVRQIIDRLAPELGFAHKQAWATLTKWGNKGWYDYGVTEDLGWFTAEGRDHFSKIP